MPLLSLILAMQLHSSAFSPGGTIPKSAAARECGGSNRSPELHWSDAPAGTKSFALVVHDPDAPVPGGYYHWAIPDVPACTASLAPGTTAFAGYRGLCPPAGQRHRYDFTLFALDERIASGAALDAKHVLDRIKGHVLGRATLRGYYGITSTR